MKELTDRSDRDLAQAVLARDRKAAAEFVEMFADDIYSFVWHRLTPKVEAIDDLVQETFLAAWTGLKSYTGQGPLRPWLLSIARHKVNDYYRRTFRWSLDPIETEDAPLPATGSESIETVLLEAELQERVAGTLGDMRPEYAALLRWRYWDRQSARDMAAHTSKTEKAVERMLARAREEFRDKWVAGGGGLDG